MQVSMPWLPATNSVPSVLWKGTARGSHPTSTKRKRILRIQTNKSHHSSLSRAHLLPFFYICFLWLRFYFFLVKWCGNFGSDVTGKRELFQWQQILVFRYCITAAPSRLLAIDHDKWLEALRGSLTPHRRSPPPNLPNVSHKLKLTKYQMLRIPDMRLEKFTF